MAYGKKYEIRFKNRIQNDVYRCEIWQKDFSGSVLQLTGAENPFAANWQEQDILSPIKSCEFTINFITDGTISMEDFYSDDDEDFRIDYYFESLSDGTGTEKLLHSGYLIEDGVSEPVTDRKHVITLKATDNLALLKNVKWNEVPVTFQYFAKLSLIYFIQWSLKATGLYSADSTIDQSLPLRIYDNLFENSTADRSSASVNDPFKEIVLNSSMFQNSDNTWQDCYSILEKILTDLNACLLQAAGYWNIIRPNEYKYFIGEVPGTEYIYPATVNAVTLGTAVNIARGGGDAYPVSEDQNKSILRPYKYILNTFNYNQPASFIKQVDLQLPKGATPYDTTTSGGFRYDKYSLATYFPYWVQTHGDTSYLQIVTDTTTNTESDRYIVTPGASSQQRGVQFNPIEVSYGDQFDFTLNFRTDVNTSSTLRFWIRMEIITAAGNFYALTNQPAPSSSINVHWTGPFSAASWDDGLGFYYEITSPNTLNTTEMQQWDLKSMVEQGGHLPIIPSDGILLIEVRGTNGSSSSNRQTTYWKDMRLDFSQYINYSTQIVGQTHQDIGTSTIKATNENDLNIDDSPRNTIAGTLFTNALTNFDFTDTVLGTVTGIGDINFTKTALWHRGTSSEALRLGNIITQERLQMRYTSRLIVEGSFRNLRYDTDKFISLLSLFQIGFYSGKNFLPASMTINYMDCSFQTKLIEVFKDSEDDFTDEYAFNYLYKTD